MVLSKRDIRRSGAVVKMKRLKVPKYMNAGSHWIVELIYYKDAGGSINVWTPGKSRLEHIWSSSDNGKYHKSDEQHFSDWRNAKSTFSKITSFKKAMSIEEIWNN